MFIEVGKVAAGAEAEDADEGDHDRDRKRDDKLDERKTFLRWAFFHFEGRITSLLLLRRKPSPIKQCRYLVAVARTRSEVRKHMRMRGGRSCGHRVRLRERAVRAIEDL